MCIRDSIKPARLTPDIIGHLRRLDIGSNLPRKRTRRRGSRKRRKIAVLDCDNRRRPSSAACKEEAHEYGIVKFNNLITVPLLPSDQQNKCKSLIIVQFNPRSVGQAEKRTAISDFILDNDVDIFCLTEFWLNPSGDEAKCADLAPPGYKTLSFPRSSRGGGIAFVVRDSLCPRLTTTTDFSFPVPFL